MGVLEVTFRLNFATRHDTKANVYVGYCPKLGIYSQGRTEKEAETAIVGAAKQFIVACYERDILHTVLRDRGMKKATADFKTSIENREQEFIAVDRDENQFELDVPIGLLDSSEEELACKN